MFLARRKDEIKVESQSARPAERAQRGPRRDVALDGADGLEHVHAPRRVRLFEVGQKIPAGQKVSRSREQVSYGQERDDLLRCVSYVFEEEIGEEDEKGAEHGEGAADNGAVRWRDADIKTHQASVRARGTVVRPRAPCCECRNSRSHG